MTDFQTQTTQTTTIDLGLHHVKSLKTPHANQNTIVLPKTPSKLETQTAKLFSAA
jgi:hypothetical protein